MRLIRAMALLFVVVLIALSASWNRIIVVPLPPLPVAAPPLFAETLKPPPPPVPPRPGEIDIFGPLRSDPPPFIDYATTAWDELWLAAKVNRGWVLLGLIREDGTWFTGPTFEIVGKDPIIFPAEGDQIKITTVQDLVIMDFRQRRGENVDISPAARELVDGDYTGLTLRSGEYARVMKIETDKPDRMKLRGVWAQVTYPQPKKFDQQ